MMISWRFVTADQFKAGPWDENCLYFLSDTHQIYRGQTLFTQAITTYTHGNRDAEITAPAVGRLYVDSTTLEGFVWDGSAYSKVIAGISDTVEAEGTTAVSGKAVAAYVADQISSAIAEANKAIVDITWDRENKLLSWTTVEGSNDSEAINGLVNAMRFDNATGQLFLVNDQGEDVGTGVNLGLHQFVRSGEVVDEDGVKYIVLYFDEEKANSVKIAATDLIDVYTGNASATASVTVASNAITVDVNISAEAGNALVAKADGLYVAVPEATDVSGKMDKATDAIEGNIAVFDAEGNAVDSGKAFEDLADNATITTGDIGVTDPYAVVTGTTPKHGDIVICREALDAANTKIQYTGYVYNKPAGEAEGTFVAMDGNYNAENVYFTKDLITTTAVGTVTLTNGQATIAAAGKNLAQVWETIFVKEKTTAAELIKTNPSLTLKFSAGKAYEVGTVLQQSDLAYTIQLNQGAYQYGPAATGVTLDTDSINVTAADGTQTYGPWTDASNYIVGSGETYIVQDNSNLKVTAVAGYSEGVAPLSNLGNEQPNAKIPALASKTMTSTAITGYRNYFYGTLTESDGEITGALIRSKLTKSGKAAANNQTFNISIPVGCDRVVIAIPTAAMTSIGDFAECLDVNDSNANIVGVFNNAQVMQTMEIDGASAGTACSYNVYVQTFASANAAANTYKFKL